MSCGMSAIILVHFKGILLRLVLTVEMLMVIYTWQSLLLTNGGKQGGQDVERVGGYY